MRSNLGFILVLMVLLATATLTLQSTAQVVQSGNYIMDLAQTERSKPAFVGTFTDDELLSNAGFETGDFPPWYHDGSWQISTSTPHTGTYCAYDIGNHWLRQDFTPTPAADIVSATLWCKQPESAIAAIDFYYSNGSYSEELIWPTAQWEQYDVTSFITPGMTVVAIRVWGYSGGGPDPDETFYDDFSIQTAGGGNITVDLTYVSGSPVPAGGGNIYYEIFVENIGASPLDFDGWLDVSYEGGPPSTLAQRSFTNFLPGWTINRPDMFFPVPESYAAGNYVFGARVGNYPAVVWAEDSFPFVKSGDIDVAGFIPFVPDGMPDPWDRINTGSQANALPDNYEILGTYPNPFNPTTTIRYALPEAGRVSLQVFDVSGRLVATLADGVRDAGYHEATFDASSLASGVYLYRLQVNDFTSTGKMVLMK
jgi:hypothetical protein